MYNPPLSMFEPTRSTPLPTSRPSRRTFAWIATAVLLLHGLALEAAEPDSLDATQRPQTATMSVRWMEPPADPAAVVDDSAENPAPVHREAIHRVFRSVPPTLPEVRRTEPAPLAVPALADLALTATATAPLSPLQSSTPPEPNARLGDPAATDAPPNVDAAAAPSTPVAAPAISSLAPSPPAAPAGPIRPETPIPVYKTRIPPPMTLHYEFQRSGIVGNGTLQWQPRDKAYTLRLEGQIAGITLLTQTSEGVLEADGLAPLRFTDQRTRRPAQAANFQRDKGVISFSGPQDQYALVPGVQDRLSWMLQLGAIVAAEPTRARVGQKVVLYVVGSRGEVDTWVLAFVDAEPVQAAGTTIKALKFMREARKPGDSQVEIWLDPARLYLPVHAKLTSGTDIFELLLKDADTTH